MKRDDQVMRAAAEAGQPTPGLNLQPKTRPTAAAKLRAGHVVLESRDHPVKVVRIGYKSGIVVIHCRYVWQSEAEPTWTLGHYRPSALLKKAI